MQHMPPLRIKLDIEPSLAKIPKILLSNLGSKRLNNKKFQNITTFKKSNFKPPQQIVASKY